MNKNVIWLMCFNSVSWGEQLLKSLLVSFRLPVHVFSLGPLEYRPI